MRDKNRTYNLSFLLKYSLIPWTLTIAASLGSCTTLNTEIVDNSPHLPMKTRDYLESRAAVYDRNIVVSAGLLDISKLDDAPLFTDTFTRKDHLLGWTVLHTIDGNIEKSGKLAKDNMTIFQGNTRLDTAQSSRRMNISFYNADLGAVTSTFSGLCGITVLPGKINIRLSFFSRPGISLHDLCTSYPLILGVNNIRMHHVDNRYILSTDFQR